MYNDSSLDHKPVIIVLSILLHVILYAGHN